MIDTSPDWVGPVAFRSRVRATSMPRRFRTLSHAKKYDGQTDPKTWLKNYRLAMKAASAPDPNFMVQYLPLFLANSARTWLNHLGEGSIGS